MSKRRVLHAPEAKPQNRVVELVEGAEPIPQDQDSPTHQKLLRRAELRGALTTLADQVAEEPIFHRNHKWDSANKFYPEDVDAHMRFVTKYYPYTKMNGTPAGPLFVDEPSNEMQVIQCYEKQKHMKKIGYRYVIIEPRRPNPDNPGNFLDASTLEDCLHQLGEL